jgi:hypothetical protein
MRSQPGNRSARRKRRARRTTAAIALLAVALAVGCAGEGEDVAAGTTTTTIAGAGPSLAQIQAQTFTPSCALSSCHDDVTRAAGLRLSSAQVSYDALVDVASTCAARVFVVPGDPDASYLLHKIGDGPAPCGALMPATLPSLDPDEVADIRAWIENGAAAPAEAANVAAVSTTTSSTMADEE